MKVVLFIDKHNISLIYLNTEAQHFINLIKLITAIYSIL